MEYHDDDGAEGHAMRVDDMANIRAAVERLIDDEYSPTLTSTTPQLSLPASASRISLGARAIFQRMA